MRTILGGDVDPSQARESIEGTVAFRGLVRGQITRSGIRVAEAREGSAAGAGAASRVPPL
jgi:hypothetical protein